MEVAPYAHRSPVTLIKEFLAGSSPTAYECGRLYIRPSPDTDGTELVAYGSEILARLDGDNLTVFKGHHSTVSQTVTDHVKRLGSILSTGGYSDLSIVVTDDSPTTGYELRNKNSDSAQYINEYVSFSADRSAVERNAVETVNEALKSILRYEFGGTDE